MSFIRNLNFEMTVTLKFKKINSCFCRRYSELVINSKLLRNNQDQQIQLKIFEDLEKKSFKQIKIGAKLNGQEIFKKYCQKAVLKILGKKFKFLTTVETKKVKFIILSHVKAAKTLC